MAKIFHICTLLFTVAAQTWAFAPPRLPQSSAVGLLLSSNLDDIDPKETALVLIEYQNEFTTPGGKLHEAVRDCMQNNDMLFNSRNLLEAARQAGCTIVHCPISFEPGHNEIAAEPYGILANVKQGQAFVSGSWGAEICSEMRPQTGEKIVKGKSGLCGFYSTNLDFLLRQANVKNVVLGGFLTNCCVESSMRTAYEHGYKVYTLKDSCAATSIEAHENAFTNNFGMFSIPTDSTTIINAIQSPSPISASY